MAAEESKGMAVKSEAAGIGPEGGYCNCFVELALCELGCTGGLS